MFFVERGVVSMVNEPENGDIVESLAAGEVMPAEGQTRRRLVALHRLSKT